ncbi:conserved hypothetical protein [Histoplasma mississippiense (nom. inval.)]|nr:conserved hypothetical protein [Histoplasma mississippiense (nom. inval.)]EDN04095.1 conserved hypothetical protein [Histoplasma mississippiense (nom. inval.)]
MEDAHAVVLDLQAKHLDKTHHPTDPDKRLSFFGVYDGHGGDRVALFAGENVHRIITQQAAFAEGDIEQALKDGFLATDRAILEEDDEFLVIACDGIWDCQTSQEVIEFVRRGIAAKQELHLICENMMDNCLASTTEGGGVGCDNMTMIIVGLLQGKTKEEWYKCIADRVARGDGPCAPPEYAEFRGPGTRRRELAEARRAYQSDIDPQLGSGSSGRVILLGNGRQLLTHFNNVDYDSSDEEDCYNMFDNDEEDEDEDEDEDDDLESQVRKGDAKSAADDTVNERPGGSPASQRQQQQQQQQSNRQSTPNTQSESPAVISASPSSTTPNDVLPGKEKPSTS